MGFNVNGRTVSLTYRMTYIHHITAQTMHTYARQHIQFPRMCVIHCRPRDGRVGSAPPPPRHRDTVSLVLSRHGRTDVMAMKDALKKEDGAAAAAARCTHNARRSTPVHALGGRATVPAHQRRQPPGSLPNDADYRVGRPPPPRSMGLIARVLSRIQSQGGVT